MSNNSPIIIWEDSPITDEEYIERFRARKAARKARRKAKIERRIKKTENFANKLNIMTEKIEESNKNLKAKWFGKNN